MYLEQLSLDWLILRHLAEDSEQEARLRLFLAREAEQERCSQLDSAAQRCSDELLEHTRLDSLALAKALWLLRRFLQSLDSLL